VVWLLAVSVAAALLKPFDEHVPRAAYRGLLAIGLALPLAAIGSASWMLWDRSVGWTDVMLLVVMYVATGLGTTLGYHRLFARGRRSAERFGDAFEERWLRAAFAAECYWTGRWDEAVERADEFIAAAPADSPHDMETACRRVRSLIRRARGDAEGAVEDARRSVEIARTANDLAPRSGHARDIARSAPRKRVEEA
jgi:hypothetical protein